MSVTEVCVAPDEDHLDAWRISNEDALERLRSVTVCEPHIGDYGRAAHVFGEVSDRHVGRLLLRFSTKAAGLTIEGVEPRRALAPVLHRVLQEFPRGVPLVMWANDGEPELGTAAG